jgi:ATP-binding cassette subfamily B protein
VLFDAWVSADRDGHHRLYVWFTFAVTEWRVKLRRQMNDRDTDANQKGHRQSAEL